MEELRKYINLLNKTEREAFSSACSTSINYLRKAISSKQRLDGSLALRIEAASKGQVKKQWLRPDIWPELTSHNETA